MPFAAGALLLLRRCASVVITGIFRAVGVAGLDPDGSWTTTPDSGGEWSAIRLNVRERADACPHAAAYWQGTGVGNFERDGSGRKRNC
jgi:hypothetical protein